MKTILMLTDFSENATYAVKSATILVEKLHADILLYNTYYDHPVMPSYAGGPWVVEEFVFRKDNSTGQLSQLAIQLRHIITDLSKDGFKPKTDYQSGEGALGHNLSIILKEKDIEFIVIGVSSHSNLEHLFFGNDTMDVINHSSRPVLIIHPKAGLKKLKKVTLATAFELADINAINYLIELGKAFSFQLEIAHVSLLEESEDPVKEKAMHNYINFLKQPNISYHPIRGKDIVNRLNRLCKENGSDLLALVHYQHGFFSNIFKKCTTEKALLSHHIPLMVIPGDME